MFPRPSYPPSRRDLVANVYHGVTVEDPYRWLENPDSPETIAWTAAQNALTRTMLDGPLRDRLEAELTRLYDHPRTSAPVPRSRRYFFTHNEGLQNQPVLYVQDGDAAPRALIDPNRLDDEGTVALTAWEPSADGRRLAYALSRGGSDWQEIFVRDVESGADLPDRLEWARFVSISWFADSSGFYYTRFPAYASYHPAIRAHRLGTPQADDLRMFGPSEDPEVVLEVDQSSDHRFVAVTAFRGASEKSAVTVQENGKVQWEVEGFADAWTFIDARDGEIYLRTTLQARRGRVVAVRPGGAMRQVIPETGDSLIDSALVDGRLAALYLRNASSRVRLFELDGRHIADVSLPALGSVTEMTGEADGRELFLRFASFSSPPVVLRCSMRNGSASVLSRGREETRANEYETSQVWYSSRDGTRVSMFLVHRQGLRRDGNRPVWLTGYGGFAINLVPDFKPAHLAWLDRGGVLAVPNLRGGGEYGEAWHEAGMLGRKQNVFDDLVAAAEWLIAQRYTRAGRIVMEGGSNGGLLVSAVLTQRPDLPGAVVCRVPVADMLRYHLFTVGRFWVPEYGCADDPDQFVTLYAYSPLHRVRDGDRYPPVLITTAETDDRVDPGMARKLTARLQAACEAGGGGPALIRIEPRAGHGAGKPVAKQIAEDADIYTFALRAVGLET